MRITIVCGHFLPELGYIEVHLAQALGRLGHSVHVVTTNAVPAYVRRFHGPVAAGVSENDGVTVHRLKPVFEMGQILAASGLRNTVRSTSPDLVVVIGLGKYFPKPVFDLDYRILTLLGDNEFSYVTNSGWAQIKSKLLFKLFKKPTYQAAIARSAHLVAYTPESFEAAAAVLGGVDAEVLRKAKLQMSLGFWPEDFFFSQELRSWKRQAMGYAQEQKVVITASRLTQEKEMEKAMAFFQQLPDAYSWLVVGSDGGAYASRFETEGKRVLGDDRFKVLPYQPRPVLNALYNAADAALYTVPAISIFEALGTGLPCLMPGEKSLSHILDNAEGLYFDNLSGPNPAKGLMEFDLLDDARIGRMDKARNAFSWTAIAGSLLEMVGVDLSKSAQ